LALALNTLNHHIPDHFARDPGCGGHPFDDFSVVAVQGEGDLNLSMRPKKLEE
jgi:hypothetical protein